MKDGNHNSRRCRERIGLIPAGGEATRIAPLPCSKELYPVGWHEDNQKLTMRPKVVSHYLLERMRAADVHKAYIVLRKGKWDIPRYFGDGKFVDLHLAYLTVDLHFGVPYTIDQAFPFIEHATVLFGFPDVIFQPDNAFVNLLERQTDTNADVVLGLFAAHRPQNTEMVAVDGDGAVLAVEIKPRRTALHHNWIIAVWNPSFTWHLHDFIEQDLRRKGQHGSGLDRQEEVHCGNVIQAAIEKGLKINSVFFSQGSYLDIGTPEDLAKTFRPLNLSVVR